MNSYSVLSLRLPALLAVSLVLCGILNAQEQASDLFSDGPKQSVVVENGTPAIKFVAKDGSVSYVYFRKRGNEYSFAINVREFKFGGEKTGWMYFTSTRIVFDSDDDGNRSFDIPKDEAKLKTEKGHGGRWFIIKVSGKEKKFMVSFTPPRPLGKQQDPVFDVIERLMTNYDEVARDFQERLAKLQKEPASAIANSSDQQAAPLASVTAVTVEITSEPSGAEIYIDGTFNSSTPAKLSLSLGEHSIRVIRPGFKEWERKITVDGKSAKTFNAVLEKN
jgi:hypothetical protein